MIADGIVGLLARCIAESATFALTKGLGNCDGRFEGRALLKPGALGSCSLILKLEQHDDEYIRGESIFQVGFTLRNTRGEVGFAPRWRRRSVISRPMCPQRVRLPNASEKQLRDGVGAVPSGVSSYLELVRGRGV